ncbi:DUF3795 domain-containing protein [Phocaeicola paurosaccharolyticus]|jgi:hypothetical protein|uniref:DUF3795 domain-containing protein n=1 Tax=Phocaeicola paurosaccharolyticus TaxID=732242 RepID=UPI0004688A74|nr:DUF3795 domain-containing protein [Phocaeicola paurosaccharolyticus]
MKSLIACCGIDCEKCEARIATIKNDCELKKKVAKKWSALNNISAITAEHINCMGCRTEGVKSILCDSLCEIRKCIEFKGYNTCGDCLDIDYCAYLYNVMSNMPECRKNIHP